MKIQILHLIGGAKEAVGLTVIIDVFRAFSTACYVFSNRADKIIPVGDINSAREIKKKNPEFLLIGEREGKKPEDFDFGNSPAQLENVDFTGKTVIQTTSSGTQGLVNARRAEKIITGSFVNAGAVVNYIRNEKPEEVSLVAMGESGKCRSDEDELCAEYLKNSIQNKPVDFSKIHADLRKSRSAEKFFNVDKKWAPRRDFELCLSLNQFNFILRAETSDDYGIVLKKYAI